jgi:hypothetical protein
MSDLMLYGVLRMPYHMAMSDHMSSFQFWSRAQEAASRLEAAEARLAELDRAPSSATTAGERQSIDTPEFRALLRAHQRAAEARCNSDSIDAVQAERSARVAIIAHIDTWAARSAANTVAPDQQKIDAKTAETRIDTGLYGSASLARSAGDAVPAEAILAKIRNAVAGYYRALNRRDHGGVAMDRAFRAIECEIGMGWDMWTRAEDAARAEGGAAPAPGHARPFRHQGGMK